MGDLRALLMEQRSLAPLPEDAQKLIDDRVVETGLARLSIVDDLLGSGLTFPLDDAMSIMEVQWEAISKTGFAQRSMEPRARGENQLPARTVYKIPIYITSDDFHLGQRLLGASRRVGAPLDLTMVTQATRRVNEAIEDAAVNGAVTVDGNSTPGLITAPNVNNFAYGSGEAWDAAGHSGQDIVDDVIGMIALAYAANRRGPFTLAVSTVYDLKLSKYWTDGTTTFPTTIRQVLESIRTEGGNLRVVVADTLSDDRTILYERSSDVIDVITGFSPMAVPWTGPTPWELHWQVMAIMVPRVKTDYDETSGVVLGELTLP
jgi:hypothetical protein